MESTSTSHDQLRIPFRIPGWTMTPDEAHAYDAMRFRWESFWWFYWAERGGRP